MTTTTATPFVIERIDLREPDTAQTWKADSVEDASAIFESEASGADWPLEEITEELASGATLSFHDADEGFEVTARPDWYREPDPRDIPGYLS